MPHWKSMMEKEFFGAWDFPSPQTGVITSVTKTKLKGSGTIKANARPVIAFKGTAKRLICNVSIGTVIQGMYGPDTADWVGKAITLYATTCNSAGGTVVECVRVKPQIPKEKGGPIESLPVDEEMRERQQAGAGETPEPNEGG